MGQLNGSIVISASELEGGRRLPLLLCSHRSIVSHSLDARYQLAQYFGCAYVFAPALMTATAARSTPSAGLGRRLAALVYDSLLLFGILCVATIILLPFTSGKAIAPGTLWYQIYLLGLIVLFYGWHWTHGGQTLGMRAWRIRLRTCDGSPLRWRHVLTRMAAAALSWAILGLGYLWLWFDHRHATWHDRLSGTEVALLEHHDY